MLRPTAAVLLTVAALLGAGAVTASGGSPTSPPDDCPGQTGLGAPVAAQERAMLCMVNFARGRHGLGALAPSPELEGSARRKARDVLRCESFSHRACGRGFGYWIRASGYLSTECWRAGENLAFGRARSGSVRWVFRAWMRSPEHRENILGDYAETGIDLLGGTLEGSAGTRVWTQHFGSRCAAS